MEPQTIAAALPPRFLPQGEILSSESQPILEYHRELVFAARSLRACLAKVSYYGWRMRLCEGWTALGYQAGFKGEEAYAESLGIARSTWMKHVKIGQHLHQLTLDEITMIPTTNAELLMQVNPAILHDYNWTREAQVLKPKRLAELVTERNKAVGDEREPLDTMVFRVAFLAKEAMEGMLEDVQKRYQLSSKGQALEFMIADLYRDANLISAVDQARHLLAGVSESLKRRNALQGQEETWLQLAMGVLDEGYAQAVQAARQKSNRSKEGGRA